MLNLKGLPQDIERLSHSYVIEGRDQTLLLEQALTLSKLLLCSNKKGSKKEGSNKEDRSAEGSNSNGSYQSSNELLSASPCGQCHSCQLFEAKNHPDFLFPNTDKSLIGVDEVRQASLFLTKTSQLSGSQVVIIHPANTMTESASNALLKTLEEPTNNSFLFLLSTDKNQLLPTIISRSQFLTLPEPTKEELKLQYPDVPDYILGFAYPSESKIKEWVNDEKIAEFTESYSTFISWLKQQIPANNLVHLVEKDNELQAFLLYLLSRRIRQLMLKNKPDAIQANELLLNYQKQHQHILGMNKPLALSALLSELISFLN